MIRAFCVALLVSMTLSSCSDSGNPIGMGNNGIVLPAFVGTPNGSQDTRAVAGLYDARELFTDEGVNFVYLAIDNNGNFFSIKHLGDCYQTDAGKISSQGEGSYLFSEDGGPGTPVSLNASNEQLIFSIEQRTAVLSRVGGLNPPYISACAEALSIDVLGIGAPLQFPDAQPGVSPPSWVIGLPASGETPPFNNNSDSTGTSDTSRIAGLWDSSSVVDGVLKIFYFSISDTGEYIGYDYLRDDFGQGSNCYSVTEFSIRYLDDDRYLFDSQFELIATVSNNRLSVTDVSTGETSIYPATTNFDSSILNCD